LYRTEGEPVLDIGLSPDGRSVVASFFFGKVRLIGLSDGQVEEVNLPDGRSVGFNSSGRLVAIGGKKYIHVSNLESGAVIDLDPDLGSTAPDDASWILALEFTEDDRLLSLQQEGEGVQIKLWDLDGRSSETLVDTTKAGERILRRRDGLRPFRSSNLLHPDGRYLLLRTPRLNATDLYSVYDLHLGQVLDRPSPRDLCSESGCAEARWHPSGRYVVTGNSDGSVRVVPMDGGAPHLLYGHESRIVSLAVSPAGDRIASGEADGAIRLWTMPEDGPPLYTLPYDEFLDRLRSLTNYRAVPDESSPTGYRIVFDRLPRWDEVPTW